MAESDTQPRIWGMHPANLLLAVVGSITIAALCAGTVYFTAQFILDSLQNSNVMALLITDIPGQTFVADDKHLERNLNSARQALVTCRDLSLALFVSCGLIACALVWKGLGFGDKPSK